VPPLNWVERAYRQAKKHASAAPSQPAALAQLLWAWGEWGYTPRDRPLVNDFKAALRAMFRARALDGRQLLMVMHGIARLDPELAPNPGWVDAFAARVAPHLPRLPPGAQWGARTRLG
jgi:hypothetical protein